MSSRLQRQLAGLRPGDHLALISQNAGEGAAATSLFVKGGLARNERCICLAGPEALEEVTGALADAGVDLPREAERHALLLAAGHDLHPGAEESDPESLAGFLRRAEEDAVTTGFAGVCLMVDSSRFLGEQSGRDRLIEGESLINRLLPHSREVVLCWYDRRRSPPAAIRDALRTHPVVVLEEELCHNPFYEPPRVALGLESEAARVVWMISRLRRSRAVETALEEMNATLEARVADRTAALEAELERRGQLEEQLLRAQRLGIAGRVAAQVAHDLNNLLMPLAIYPGLIKMRLPESHPATALCDAMLEASQQIGEITEDLMALGRRGQIERQAVALGRVVEQAVERVSARFPDPIVVLNLAPDLLPVDGSQAQLLRLVANLLTNACEAVQNTGHIALKGENVYVDEPFGRYGPVEIGEYVRLSVSDDGAGIPLEIRDRIFDPFFTTKVAGKRRGSGLGLTVAHAIVSDHRGYLDLESEVGKGTTFSVYLPVRRETVEEVHIEVLPGGSETVLVVDDDQLQREVVGRLLEALGYRVRTASSGEEAVANVLGSPVDLVLLDMVMPPGIDGLEAYRRMLKVRPAQRAIVLSGFARSERVQEAQALGSSIYLRKPVSPERLARAVREALDGRPIHP